MSTEAEISLAKTGPGGICADCGHFAERHIRSDIAPCIFPRPKDNPCKCKGMLWQGERVNMEAVLKEAAKL